ncbi:M48 family metalloprotease [Hippea alviniae]|uniref:M48 family metalloprotease n=1 Tax=Hippea alviniae TaxID=1279027 RepID=UPI0003B5315D|nr:M48 family metalloprotease [Hippea alviniae]
MSRRIRLFKGVLLFLTLFLLNSCTINPATGRKELVLLSMQQEFELGSKAYKDIVSTYGIYRYKNLNAYVKSVGLRVVSHADLKIPYHFILLDSEAVNAFSTPGGYIYITRGILAYLNNEAQLATVIGHEAGHINAHHVASMISKQLLFNLGLAIAYSESKKFRRYIPLIGIAGNLLFLSFSREDEYQADYLDVKYATLAGYDATQMAKFFDELMRYQSEKHYSLPEFLATHPSPPHRKEKIYREVRLWQSVARRKYYEIGRDRYLAHINGILFGKDKRYGYVEGNHYYHPAMRFEFRFPKGWSLSDTRRFILVYNPKVKGEFIKITTSKVDIYTLAAKFSNRSPIKHISVNGFDAFEFSKVISENGVLFYKKGVFVRYGSTSFIFIAQSPLAVYRKDRFYLNMPMKTFKRLTDSSKIYVKNTYVKVVKVKRSCTFESLLKQLGIKRKFYKTIYVMNNMYPDTLLAEGELVKVLIER